MGGSSKKLARADADPKHWSGPFFAFEQRPAAMSPHARRPTSCNGRRPNRPPGSAAPGRPATPPTSLAIELAGRATASIVPEWRRERRTIQSSAALMSAVSGLPTGSSWLGAGYTPGVAVPSRAQSCWATTSGLIGICVTRIDAASRIAFAIVAGPGIAGGSPTPLEP